MSSLDAASGTFQEVHAATGIRLGFMMAARRLISRSTLLLIALSLALAVVAGIVERRVTTLGAVDRSLVSTFRLVVPLYCFAIAGSACHRMGLRDAVWPVARFGASRRDVALGIVLALVIASAMGGVLLSVAAVVSSYGASSRPLVIELFTSGWIGALVAAAYGGWFALGATFLDRGRGRGIVLALDFLFGAGTGVLAAVFPRSHARGLLGDVGPAGFSQPRDCIALVVMLLVLAALAVMRARD